MSTDIRQGWTSASNAPADALCEGRHLAQKGLRSESSEDALSGSAVHAALATGDTSKLSLDERETFDACREIEAKLIEQFFGATVPKTFRHERYWYEFSRLKPNSVEEVVLKHSGELDACHRLGPKALVIDFKSLMGEVAKSPRNMQLRDHAVLVRNEFIFITEVATAIVQPWVTRTPEVCLYTEADLIEAERQLVNRVIASNDPKSKRVAGEVQCKFCLAAKHGTCLEYQKWAGQSVPSAAMLALLEVPVAQWTPEQRAQAMNALKPARKLLDAIEDTVRAGIAAQGETFCPGWKLIPGYDRKTINNPDEVYKRFIALGGKHAAFMEAVQVTKGDLRLALHDTTGARGDALDNAIDAITKGCVSVKRTAGRLERTDGND